jgi:hypothetical protein
MSVLSRIKAEKLESKQLFLEVYEAIAKFRHDKEI